MDPVIIELSAEQPTVAISISNDSDEPASIQIQTFAWSQLNGEDIYIPTRDLLVSPPIFTIAPNSEQIIRAALRRQADPAVELTYRIFLNELPAAAPSGFRGVQVALRIGLPVFVQSQVGNAAPGMVWSVAQAPGNKLQVTLQNTGSAHVQVSDFEFFIPGSDAPVAGEAGSSYVLAGQTRKWLIELNDPAHSHAGRLQLKANTDAGSMDVELAVDMP